MVNIPFLYLMNIFIYSICDYLNMSQTMCGYRDIKQDQDYLGLSQH